MPDPLLWKQRIRTLRAFNYSDTMQAGVLRERLLHSSYSLTESRVILEISRQSTLTATDLSRNLGLDPGYLSRLLGRLESGSVIERPRSERDGRRRFLKLTEDGKRIAQLLNRRVDDDVAEYLAGLTEPDQARLMEAIRTIEEINDSRAAYVRDSRYFLREAEPSDAERLTKAYGTLFEQTFGSADAFDDVIADTNQKLFDSASTIKARCWIAEMNGESAGSIIVEPLDEERMHIKMFMVESKRRGLGIGGSLLNEAIRHAQQNGCRKLVLWAVRDHTRLQRLLTRHGFNLDDRPNISYYGMKFDLEYWELPFSPTSISAGS